MPAAHSEWRVFCCGSQLRQHNTTMDRGIDILRHAWECTTDAQGALVTHPHVTCARSEMYVLMATEATVGPCAPQLPCGRWDSVLLQVRPIGRHLSRRAAPRPRATPCAMFRPHALPLRRRCVAHWSVLGPVAQRGSVDVCLPGGGAAGGHGRWLRPLALVGGCGWWCGWGWWLTGGGLTGGAHH